MSSLVKFVYVLDFDLKIVVGWLIVKKNFNGKIKRKLFKDK